MSIIHFFKYLKFDLKKLSIFCFKTKLISIGFFSIYKIFVLAGISKQLNSSLLPSFVIRSVNYTLRLFRNKLNVLGLNLKKYKRRVENCLNLKSFLVNHYLPSNGQRTKTNAKTVKKLSPYRKKKRRRRKK